MEERVREREGGEREGGGEREIIKQVCSFK